MANAYRDQNSVPTLIASSNVDGQTPVRVYADPVTHRLLVDTGGSSSGITSINGDTTAAQTLAVGTAGTDFAIADNGTGTHTFNLPTASHTNRGALSSADWDTFNGKQAAGNYITALTGDVTASGPGSAAATLATVNANVGSFTHASITVNAKGLITAASSGTVTSGTVTTVSVVSANGFAGTVANATTTPAITMSTTITGILKGDGTAISAATAGTDYVTASSTNTFTNKTYDTAGTGNSFSINGVAVTANTGTGAVARAAGPTFTTPTLGAATATSINGLAITTSTGTLTIPNGVTLTGPASSGTAATLGNTETFTGAKTFAKNVQTVTAMGAQALDGSLGNVFTRTLANSETFTQSNFSAGQCFIVEVTQGSGTSYTVTWFSGVTWVTSGATAPVQTTTSSGITTYGFRCTGTNTFLGYLVGTQ